MSTRTPSLQETIAAAVAAGLLDVHTAIPARIVRYDAATQKADCKPLVKRAYPDEAGARQVDALPVIPGAPVMFPGAGGFRVTFPVRVGDTCLLIFSEAPLDRWKSGEGQEVDPEVDHAHALMDAVCILGLRPFGAALEEPPSDVCTIGQDGADFQPIGLGTSLKDHLDALKSYIDGHTHPVPGTGTTCVNGSPWTGTATSAAPSSSSPSVPTVESTTVQVSE